MKVASYVTSVRHGQRQIQESNICSTACRLLPKNVWWPPTVHGSEDGSNIAARDEGVVNEPEIIAQVIAAFVIHVVVKPIEIDVRRINAARQPGGDPAGADPVRTLMANKLCLERDPQDVASKLRQASLL